MTTCGDYGGDRDASAGAGGGEVRPKTSNLTGMAKGGTRREGGGGGGGGRCAHLDSIKAVQAQIVQEVRLSRHLGRINLLESLDAAEDAISDISLVKECGTREPAARLL